MISDKIKEFYVSVDVETTGPIPGKYSMSSIGAFVAGARTEANELISFAPTDKDYVYYSEIAPLEGSTYLNSAIMVGGLRDYEDNEALTIEEQALGRFTHMASAPAPLDALAGFANFVNCFSLEFNNAKPIFVAYPLSFDWTFVYWYMCTLELTSPFGFSSTYDLKTAYSAYSNKGIGRVSSREIKKKTRAALEKYDLKHTHFADDDAIEQGVMGIELMKLLAQNKNKLS